MDMTTLARAVLFSALDNCGAEDPAAQMTDDAIEAVGNALLRAWNDGYMEGAATARAYGYSEVP